MKVCNDADLGLVIDEDGAGTNNEDRSNTHFTPTHEGSIGDLTFYRKKLHCFDWDAIEQLDDPSIPKRLELQGDFSSPRGRVLKLTFEKCDREALGNFCKSDD